MASVDEPRAALDALVRGTGLEYQFVNDETVVIRAAVSTGKARPVNLTQSAQPASESILLAQVQHPEGQATSNQREPDEDDADAETADAEPEDAVEEIIVTGSRLKRTSSQIAANLVTWDEDALQSTGEISLDNVNAAVWTNRGSTFKLATISQRIGEAGTLTR